MKRIIVECIIFSGVLLKYFGSTSAAPGPCTSSADIPAADFCLLVIVFHCLYVDIVCKFVTFKGCTSPVNRFYLLLLKYDRSLLVAYACLHMENVLLPPLHALANVRT